MEENIGGFHLTLNMTAIILNAWYVYDTLVACAPHKKIFMRTIYIRK